MHLLTRVTDPYRHYLEASYLFHLLGGEQNEEWEAFMQRGDEYLVSGICLGMQTMHVATGGRMIQDIPTEVYGLWNTGMILALPADEKHRNYHGLAEPLCEKPTSYHYHRIRIPRGSFLDFYPNDSDGPHPRVLSSHHQALEEMGESWRVSATSMDGMIIEAMEHRLYPHVVAVQFHPEKPGIYDPAIRHRMNCGAEISFHEEIRGSDSYDFHLAYWEWVRETLQLIRSR
jgi:putative glutamine amidotransferase